MGLFEQYKSAGINTDASRKLTINPAWHGAAYEMEMPDQTPLPKASGPRSKESKQQRWRAKNKKTYNDGQAALMRRRREKNKQ